MHLPGQPQATQSHASNRIKLLFPDCTVCGRSPDTDQPVLQHGGLQPFLTLLLVSFHIAASLPGACKLLKLHPPLIQMEALLREAAVGGGPAVATALEACAVCSAF